MSEPIPFRPHHLLCALGFEGKGYSDAFNANMARIVDGRLRGPDGDKIALKVGAGADAICGPCPQRIGTGCLSQVRVNRLDRAHAAALALQKNEVLTWGAAKSRICAAIAPDDLDRICVGCRWLPMGMCKAAVARLRSE